VAIGQSFQPTDQQLQQAFTAWLDNYGKTYASQQEQDSAYQNFVRSLNVVGPHNTMVEGDMYGEEAPPGVVSKRQLVAAPPLQMSVNFFADLSPAQFAQYAGALPPIAAAAAALSVGVIAAIAVAAAVGTAGVVGTTAAVVYYKKRRQQAPKIELETPKPKKQKGIDLYYTSGKKITSITARAPPREE